MDRIESIGPRPAPWQPPALDPDREDIADRRRREGERRRRERDARAEAEQPAPEGDDPPHHVDVRA